MANKTLELTSLPDRKVGENLAYTADKGFTEAPANSGEKGNYKSSPADAAEKENRVRFTA